jgi:cell division protease FtsH
VHKVSIIPRGLGALGYTMQLTLEERYIVQRPELYDKLTVLMGGRAAEQMMYGVLSTGAADDLERATVLARRMIVQYGMSDVLGPQAYGSQHQESRFLPGVVIPGDRQFSERTAESVDAEVTALLSRLYDRALEILRVNRPSLEALAHELLVQEVVEGERLRTLLAGAKMPPGEGAETGAPGHVH